MRKGSFIPRIVLGACTATLLAVAGRAEAACDADGNASPAGSACYVLKGSDTLFDIMSTAVNQARAGGTNVNGVSIPVVTGASDLFYAGTGSGNAEAAMRTASTGGIGVQSIGPMSRNFRPAIIDALSPDFTKRCLSATDPGCTAANATATGHAAWAPTSTSVVGLDAAVFVVKNGVNLDNVDFTTFVDASVPTAFKKGDINNASISSAFGNGNGFGNKTAACTLCGQSGQPACPANCVNYNNIMSIVMGGVDGSGTLAACADPRRVQAIQDLAGFLGATTLNHLFRRDDNSGTTDTFKDRIIVVKNTGSIATRYVFTGGRFCNGTAVGQISGAAPQQGVCSNNRALTCFANKDCGTPNIPPSCTTTPGPNQCVYCQYNLNNQDFDPIRRPCSPSDGTRAATSCTDMTTGQPCQANDGNPNCTQGFVVALSDADPGSPDVTVSIGKRVGLGDGSILGYAGREAALGTGAKAIKINTLSASDSNVRDSSYMLARRLFIQNTFVNSTDANDVPTDNQTANSVTGAGAAQLTAEQNLWNQFLSNRALMDPIVRQFNFIRCASGADGDDPNLESGNLCAITPAAPVPSPFGAYTPSGGASNVCSNNPTRSCAVSGDCTVPAAGYPSTGTCGGNGGGAKSINSAGRQWNGASAATITGASGLCVSGVSAGKICNGGTKGGQACTVDGDCPGSTCSTTTNNCPDAAPRPANAPCTVGTDCVSGACGDFLSHSTGGKDGLYCQ
jgi:hypothetical protein